MDTLLRELEPMLQNEDIPISEKLDAEREYLGYCSYTSPSLKGYGLVVDINSKYSPKITVYKLDTSETVTYKLQKALYQKNPFDKGQVIKFFAENRPKSKLVDGKWIKDPTQSEPWITNYLVKDL